MLMQGILPEKIRFFRQLLTAVENRSMSSESLVLSQESVPDYVGLILSELFLRFKKKKLIDIGVCIGFQGIM